MSADLNGSAKSLNVFLKSAEFGPGEVTMLDLGDPSLTDGCSVSKSLLRQRLGVADLSKASRLNFMLHVDLVGIDLIPVNGTPIQVFLQSFHNFFQD